MKHWLIIVVWVLSTQLLFAQTSDQQLAQHYYGKGEFDKALVYYEKLYDNDPSKINFTRYVDCLTATNDDKTAEKILRKEAGRNRDDAEYAVLLARFYEERNEQQKADEIYNELIASMQPY